MQWFEMEGTLKIIDFYSPAIAGGQGLSRITKD